MLWFRGLSLKLKSLRFKGLKQRGWVVRAVFCIAYYRIRIYYKYKQGQVMRL